MPDEEAKCWGKAEVITPKHLTKAFEDAWKMGRVEKYLVDLGWEKMIVVYNIYGQSVGSMEDKAVNEAIIAAIRADNEQEQHLATIIMGDINANPESLHNIKELVDEEGWIDVGLHADWWGGNPEETTCESRPGAKPSRIDVIIASPEAALYIREVWVRKTQPYLHTLR